MRSLLATMSYLELLKLASPEAIVVITALVVLTIGLTSGRGHCRGKRVACNRRSRHR